MRFASLFSIAVTLLGANAAQAQNYWEPASGAPAGTVHAFVATRNGHVFAASDIGIYRSTDSGMTWTSTNTDVNNIDGYTLLAADSNGNVYAGGNGIFRSTDEGNSWAPINAGLGKPGYFIEVQSIAASPDGTVFAVAAGIVYRSTNAGNAWARLDTSLTQAGSLAVSRDGKVFCTSNGSVFRSTDSGSTWQKLDSGLANAKITALAF